MKRYFAMALLFAGAAALMQAQSLDTGDMTSEAEQLLIFLKLIAAIAAVASIIFAALAVKGRNIGEGVISLLCAIGAIFIIGHAQGWVTTVTGVAL